MTMYRTIWDHTCPYWSILDQSEPYGPYQTIWNNKRVNRTIRNLTGDHTGRLYGGPYMRTIWGEIQKTIWETIKETLRGTIKEPL